MANHYSNILTWPKPGLNLMGPFNCATYSVSVIITINGSGRATGDLRKLPPPPLRPPVPPPLLLLLSSLPSLLLPQSFNFHYASSIPCPIGEARADLFHCFSFLSSIGLVYIKQKRSQVANIFFPTAVTLSSTTLWVWPFSGILGNYPEDMLPQNGNYFVLTSKFSNSVVIFAHPSALDLPTRTTVTVVTRVGANNGMRIKGEALERNLKRQHVIFEKKRTLIQDKVVISFTKVFRKWIEKSSQHWSLLLRLSVNII